MVHSSWLTCHSGHKAECELCDPLIILRAVKEMLQLIAGSLCGMSRLADGAEGGHPKGSWSHLASRSDLGPQRMVL